MSLWGVKHLGTREGGSWIWQCQNIPIIRFAGQTCSATYITRKHDLFVVIFIVSAQPSRQAKAQQGELILTKPNQMNPVGGLLKNMFLVLRMYDI